MTKNGAPNPDVWVLRRVIQVFALGVVVLLGVVGWQYVRFTGGRTTALTDVHDLLTTQERAWNQGDLDGFMAGYRMSEDITFYSGGDVKRGWIGLRERYDKKYRAGGQSMGTLTFSDLSIDILAADSAVARGRWKLQLAEKTPSGLFTLLLRKYPDGWRIVHDHTSVAE